MSYRRLSAASNSGMTVVNQTCDFRRASITAGRIAGERIGRIFSISASSAYCRAISRRNALPRLGPITVRNAEMAMRIDTASGVTGGISSGGSMGRFEIPRIPTAKAVKGEQVVNFDALAQTVPMAIPGTLASYGKSTTRHCVEA